MKRDDKQIDKLTRKLMEGSVEKPSSELLARVMKQVAKEQADSRKSYNLSRPVITWMVAVLVAYFLFALGMGYLLLAPSEPTAETSQLVKGLFTLIVALSVGASFFFCCAQLDNWMRWKEHHR